LQKYVFMAKRPPKKIIKPELTELIIDALKDKKGRDITIIDFKKISNTICDYFIIAHGTSGTQVETLVSAVERKVKTELGYFPKHVEGLQNAEWVLLDYFDVIVHIFNETTREFYRLEDLWADGDIIKLENEN
jgi:ribosome-associated protein